MRLAASKTFNLIVRINLVWRKQELRVSANISEAQIDIGKDHQRVLADESLLAREQTS